MLLSDTSSKESLASVTRGGAVVLSSRAVSADRAIREHVILKQILKKDQTRSDRAIREHVILQQILKKDKKHQLVI